jgi:hypothetical protein
LFLHFCVFVDLVIVSEVLDSSQFSHLLESLLFLEDPGRTLLALVLSVIVCFIVLAVVLKFVISSALCAKGGAACLHFILEIVYHGDGEPKEVNRDEMKLPKAS